MTDNSSPERGGGPPRSGGGGGRPRDGALGEAPLHQPSAGPPPRAGKEWRARHALATATAAFAFSATPRLDAELLMAHAMGVSRDVLLLARLDDPVPPTFAALVERRVRHEPIAYITGTRGFWTVDLAVGPGVLVPRADSEVLIEAAASHFGARAPASVLDLGTGPGTLLLAALDLWPAQGIGIDRSAEALDYARANAATLGMARRAHFVRADWAAGIAGRFDLVLANPPYIATAEPLPDEVRAYEPAAALFAGPDGLDAYRALVPQLPRLVAPGGVAILEIGATQAEAVAALLEAQGIATRLVRDYGDRPRALVCT